MRFTTKIDNYPQNSMEYVNKDMFVYALKDPRTNEIRYVGQTEDGLNRFRSHKYVSKKQAHLPKQKWILELRSLGMGFGVDILGFGSTKDELDKLEVFWIKHLSGSSCDLFNRTVGGGSTTKMVPDNPFMDQLGGYYKNVSEASRLLESQPANIRACLRGKREHVHGRTFRYIGQITKDFFSLELKSDKRFSVETRRKGSASKGCKPFCDQFGDIYHMFSEAKEKLKVDRSSVRDILHGEISQIKGYAFAYLDSIPDGFIDHKIRESGKSSIKRRTEMSITRGGKPFTDQYGNIYQILGEAAKNAGVSRSSVYRSLTGITPKTKTGYVFTYL